MLKKLLKLCHIREKLWKSLNNVIFLEENNYDFL